MPLVHRQLAEVPSPAMIRPADPRNQNVRQYKVDLMPGGGLAD